MLLHLGEMVGNCQAPVVHVERELILPDGPQDECGFVTVNTPGLDAGKVACVGIIELSNRGYEATGVSVMAKTPRGDPFIKIEKGFGKGCVVFPDRGESLSANYPSHQAEAQARYSTQGTNELSAAQPHGLEVQTEQGMLQFSHVVNGNLINTTELAAYLGKKPGEYSSDSELAAMAFADAFQRLAHSKPETPVSLTEVVRHTLPKFHGSFMGAVMMNGETVVYCDPHGLKPAVVGRLPDYGIMVASEVTALDANNATLIQEVLPGSMVVINEDGSRWHTEQWTEPQPGGCVLELLYVMRTEGNKGTKAIFHGIEVETARENAGYALASVAPAEADFVCGLPNSAKLAGKGYERGSTGIKYLQYLEANKLDKSFIAPTQEQRAQMVREKIFVPDEYKEQIAGKRLVLVDDTLIRGTTMREVIAILKECEPAEIHLRIACDRFRFICELGMDMGNLDELLAVTLTDSEICKELGIDSLAFLPVETLNEVVLGDKANEFCTGCLTGKYPTDRPKPFGEDVAVSLQKNPALAGSLT